MVWRMAHLFNLKSDFQTRMLEHELRPISTESFKSIVLVLGVHTVNMLVGQRPFWYADVLARLRNFFE